MARRSRIGLTEDCEDAVLSVMIAIFFGRLPEAASARRMISGTARSDMSPAVAEVWNTYLKPRLVMRSEKDKVRKGSPARSVTSVAARVKEDR